MDRIEQPPCGTPGFVISGMVVTLDGDPQVRQDAIAAITTHPGVQAGAPRDQWLPIAAETRSERESRELHDWILSRPGVLFVDVVAVSFDPQFENVATV